MVPLFNPSRIKISVPELQDRDYPLPIFSVVISATSCVTTSFLIGLYPWFANQCFNFFYYWSISLGYLFGFPGLVCWPFIAFLAKLFILYVRGNWAFDVVWFKERAIFATEIFPIASRSISQTLVVMTTVNISGAFLVVRIFFKHNIFLL